MPLKIKIHERTHSSNEHIQESDMSEGIDVVGKKVIYNPNHSLRVDTREKTMMPIERKITLRVMNTDKVVTYPVISIFGRNTRGSDSRQDGNPLVYALKGEGGWSFKSEVDKEKILDQALKVAKNLFSKHPIDTIVFAPSTNPLNRQIAEIVKQACPQAVMLPNTVIQKKKTKDVFSWLDYSWIRYILGRFDPNTRGFGNDPLKWREYIDTQEKLMDMFSHDMGSTFTYHSLPLHYRQAIPQSAEVGDICGQDVHLNDKNVAIIDDTLTTGKTLSDISELILKMYVPKSITFITMFSSRNAVDLDTEVPTADWRDNLQNIDR